MTRTIYIATTVSGRGVRFVTGHDGVEGLRSYAREELAMTDRLSQITSRSSISAICDALADHGPCAPHSRYHFRVSRKDALRLIHNGAEGYVI